MKKLMFLVFLVFIAFLPAEENRNIFYPTFAPDSLQQAELDSVCAIRGHTVVQVKIEIPEVSPELVDYPEKTIMYYYENNIATAKSYRCQRCGRWVGTPIMDPPKEKVFWKLEEVEE